MSQMNKMNIGFLSALLTTAFGCSFIAALFASLLGLLPQPWDTFWQLLPSIFLAWSFMTLMACYYKSIPNENNIYLLVGFGFALIYATINSIVYFTELTVVIPAILAGTQSNLEVLLFEPRKFLFAINGLAYTLMSLSVLISSLSFRFIKNQAFVKYSMIAHGLIAPFVCGAVIWEPLKYIGALWIVTFPMFGVASLKYFLKSEIE
jgi:hypothetical protein